MKSYSSKEIIAILLRDGWYEVGHVGDHKHFKHPTKKGKTTVTHPIKTLPTHNLKNIEKQAGIKLI